jgi:uncharacterized membrane protein YebE (DUF533 family)
MDPQQAAPTPTEPQSAPLTLEDGVSILKAVKVLAASDGFSGMERAGLRKRMRQLGIPEHVQDEIDTFDPHSVSLEDALRDFPPGGLKARYLLIAAISVASVDGYSDEERLLIRHAAAHVGLSEPFVEVLEAAERVARMVELLRNPELADAWQALGGALLKLEHVATTSH